MNENGFYRALGNGISKMYTNDTEGALKEFSEAIQMGNESPFDKRFAIAFHLRGNVHSQIGNYADGIADRKKAMEFDPEYEKLYNNLENNFARIDRIAIDSVSISNEKNFQKIFSEFSNVRNALEWIKEYLRNEPLPNGEGGKKSIRRKSNEESIKTVIKKLLETEFKNKVKKGETVNGGIRSKILSILSTRNKIFIDDRQLRSYLSRLEYTAQRAHSSDSEYGFASNRYTRKPNLD